MNRRVIALRTPPERQPGQTPLTHGLALLRWYIQQIERGIWPGSLPRPSEDSIRCMADADQCLRFIAHKLGLLDAVGRWVGRCKDQDELAELGGATDADAAADGKGAVDGEAGRREAAAIAGDNGVAGEAGKDAKLDSRS